MKSTHHNRGDRRGPGRWPVVAAAVPVIMMAGAWSAAVAQTTGGDDAVAAGQNLSVPDVPSAESSTPLVVTTPTTTPPGAAKVTPVGSTSTQEVPAASLAAYKRASTVLAASDAACRLPWNLVAAIGKIESDHGRYGGNVVGVDGVSRPGVLGIALDGTNNTARILDSDAGALDRDTTYDRAVGPMQFIPSTWSAVAVDGNGDGVKNPQDVNDAAVSAGVYLCAGGGDLSTPAGARSAVLRYNQSGPYADSVLALSTRYAAGDFSQAPATTSVPTDTTPAAPVTPVTPAEVTTPGKGVKEVAAAALLPHPTVVAPSAPYEPAAPQPTTPTTPAAPTPAPPTSTPTPAPTTPATTPAPTPTPTQPTRTPSATPTPSPKPTPTPSATPSPTPTPSATPSPTPSPSATPTAEECDGVTVTGSTETAGSPADGACVPPCEDGTEPDADVETPCAIVTKP